METVILVLFTVWVNLCILLLIDDRRQRVEKSTETERNKRILAHQEATLKLEHRVAVLEQELKVKRTTFDWTDPRALVDIDINKLKKV